MTYDFFDFWENRFTNRKRLHICRNYLESGIVLQGMIEGR
jgi:hypothetical protein